MTTHEFQTLALGLIVPSLTNPRKHFDAARLTELASSIKTSGVHQPILVRPLPGSRVEETRRGPPPAGHQVGRTPLPTHEIVAGERRYRASQQAGLASIPCLVRHLTDEQVLEVQLVENLQRDDLSALEEAEGYHALMAHSKITADALAIKTGKSRSYVFSRLKLLDLSSECQEALRTGAIDASRALLIARIPDTKLQAKALAEISRKSYDGSPVHSYRSAAAYIQREFMLRLDGARFKITDAALVVEAGSCRTCSKRTGHDPDLFADVNGADVCTDPACFHTKEQAHTEALLRSAHERGQTVIAGREAKALMPNSWGGVEGFLRLDDPRDSPTDKPLRKLLGKQLDGDDVKPTLIANPHKDGELIAVLPSAKVAELLKANGHDKDASTIQSDLASDRKALAARAKTKLKEDYEQGWRTLLMERTWAAIEAANEGPTPWPDLDRLLAMRYTKGYNNDKNKVACKLLGLGKVAPGAGVQEHIKSTPTPQRVLLLLIMIGDVEYSAWREDPDDANADLMLVAKQYNVDVEAIQAECKKAVAVKVKAPTKAAESAKTKTKPSEPKPSAKDAKAAIAAAMQEQEANSGTDAQGIASQQPDQWSDLSVARLVRVTADRSRLHVTKHKWAGKKGTITQKMGDRSWLVTFKGRSGGLSSFDGSELEVVT